jgi:hypothetical protein
VDQHGRIAGYAETMELVTSTGQMLGDNRDRVEYFALRFGVRVPGRQNGLVVEDQDTASRHELLTHKPTDGGPWVRLPSEA